MREKHSKIPILVLTVTTVLLFAFFMLPTSQAFAAQGHKGNGSQKQWQNQKQHNTQPQKQRNTQPQKQHNTQPQAHRDYNNQHADYDRYPGYRPRPYNRGLHYGHYKHRGRQYDYRGHWRSWNQWDRYLEQHPDIRRDGRYYRENAHLMFRFCEPGSGACFFFSIGG